MSASYFCGLKATLKDFSRIQYESAADAMKNQPGFDAAKRQQLAGRAKQSFSICYFGSPSICTTSSGDHVKKWYSEASKSCTSIGTRVLSRLRVLYAEDYALFKLVRPPFKCGTEDTHAHTKAN